MPEPNCPKLAKGIWHGKSQLNLPFLPPEKRASESDSRLHVDTDAHHAFATLTYQWAHEGVPQEGTILVCQSHKTPALDMGWVDSWHQDGSVMHLRGEAAQDGAVKAKDTYSAGEETWGWTIALSLNHNQFTITMENISPNGEAVWAAKATYTRDGSAPGAAGREGAPDMRHQD